MALLGQTVCRMGEFVAVDGVPCVEELGTAEIWCLGIGTFWYRKPVLSMSI